MLNSLDLLVLVFMVMAALGALALALMFLMKNRVVRTVCLYITAALGAYLGGVGFYIGGWTFFGKMVIGILCIGAAIAAAVLGILAKRNEKLFTLARILAAAAAAIGIINAIL